MDTNKRALNPGTLIHNRYYIERVLGEGGFGVTYQVTDRKYNQIAAMKEYMPADIAYRRPGSVEVLARPDYTTSYDQFREKFLKEAQIIYQYRGHPNIVDVRHLFYENNTAYYVMEFINGMDMAKYLKQNGQRLSWEALRPIISQVCAALQEVHRSGMIHCDIKPDNIFILNGGQVKLIDFGAAKSTIQGRSSMMLLTRGFAPPEQLSAQGRIGPWTDIYALAVTIYRAYTGRMPPSAEERLGCDKTVWPSEMGIAAPSPYWEQVLRKAMALRVNDRYQSVGEFWADLSSAAPTSYSQVATSGAQFSGPTYTYADPADYDTPAGTGGVPVLECIRGIFQSTRIPLQGEIIFGTNPNRCNFTFPPGSPGISKVHMRIWPEDGEVLIVDMGSTYGTWLNNQKMTPGLIYSLNPGEAIYLGDGQVFCLRPESG